LFASIDTSQPMEEPPFRHDQQLCDCLAVTDTGNILVKDAKLPASLPGQPRMELSSPQIRDYLRDEFVTPTLNTLAPSWLWLVAKQDSSHVSAVHQQLVRGREIVITENPELHLVWYYEKIFLKPIPEYLMSHAFWTYYLCRDSDFRKSSPVPSVRRSELVKGILGFLRSYSYLIRHESDYLLAIRESQRLLPDGVEWRDFALFITQFADVQDTDVSPRYHFGELRLTRLNFWVKVRLGRFYFQKVHGQYGSYFARFYGPLLFVFAVFSVLLSAMQVVLGVEQAANVKGSWQTFASVSRWFSVVSIISAAVTILILLVILSLLIFREVIYALVDLCRKRNSKKCPGAKRPSAA
jgi:hypothetical protein